MNLHLYCIHHQEMVEARTETISSGRVTFHITKSGVLCFGDFTSNPPPEEPDEHYWQAVFDGEQGNEDMEALQEYEESH